MLAIFRREWKAYFNSPIGYIYLAAFVALSQVFYFIYCILSASNNMGYVFSSLFSFTMFLLPVLTMRTMSEDKRQKTDQALLTAPVSLGGLVMGKFLGAFAVYLLGLSVTIFDALILAAFSEVEWAVFFGNFIGMALYGAAIIALGVFISSLTENQVVAAVGGIIAAALLSLMDTFAQAAKISWVSKILQSLSIFSRYYEFTIGVFNIANAVFFISFAAVFIFFTVRVLEKRRWS